MHRFPVCLVIGTIGLAAAAGCGDQTAGERAEKSPPGLEQEARELEQAAETGAAARTASAVEKGVEQAAEDVEEQGVAATAKEAGEKLEGNVERSAQVYEDTYQEKRAAGEGVVDASGDAYDAVLEEPDEESKD